MHILQVQDVNMVDWPGSTRIHNTSVTTWIRWFWRMWRRMMPRVLTTSGKASTYQPSGKTLASCSNHCFKSVQTSFTVLSVYSCKILGPVAMHSSRTIPKAHWKFQSDLGLVPIQFATNRSLVKQDQLDTSTQQQHSRINAVKLKNRIARHQWIHMAFRALEYIDLGLLQSKTGFGQCNGHS